MLGSGRKDCDPNLWRGCASFTPWVIATALQLRSSGEQFSIIPNISPAGSIQRGNHTINFVETLHREGFGGHGPGTVTASAYYHSAGSRPTRSSWPAASSATRP